MCRTKLFFSFLVAVVCVGLVSVSQAADPVAHWTFDEVVVVDGIAIAPDVSGNCYDGILKSKAVVSANDPNDPNATMEIVINSPADAVDPLIMDGVLVCDGNGFVDIPVEAWNDNIVGEYTVSFRILIPELMGTVPMAAKMFREDGSEVRNFGCHAPWSNGRVYFDTTPAPDGHAKFQRVNTGNISDQIIGKWVTYFFVYEPGRQEIYLDGEMIKSGTGIGDPNQDTTTFTIGAGQEGDVAIVGMMDDVRLYDVALTTNEVRAMLGLPPVPVAHWTFDELTVESANDPNDPNATISIAADVSGNGYDGILQSKAVVSANDPNDPNATMEIVINSPADAVDPLIMDGVLVCDGNGFVDIPVEAWNDNIVEGYTVSFRILIPEIMSTVPMAAKMFREDGSEVRNFSCHTPWSNGTIYFDTTPAPDGHARYQRVNIGGLSDQFIGQWATYAFVYEPNNRQEIWLNGEMIQSGSGPGDPNQDTTSFTFGAGKSADGTIDVPIVGMMDDVRLYDVALTADQVKDVVVASPAWVLEDFEADLSAWNMDASFPDTVSIDVDPLDPNNSALQILPSENGGLFMPWTVGPNDLGSLSFRMLSSNFADVYSSNMGMGTADEADIAWGNMYSIVRMGEGTNMSYRDGDDYVTNIEVVETMKWYDMLMDLDMANGKYDFYVDGELVKAGAAFRSSDPNGIANVLIRHSNKMTDCAVYIDDIVGKPLIGGLFVPEEPEPVTTPTR